MFGALNAAASNYARKQLEIAERELDRITEIHREARENGTRVPDNYWQDAHTAQARYKAAVKFYEAVAEVEAEMRAEIAVAKRRKQDGKV